MRFIFSILHSLIYNVDCGSVREDFFSLKRESQWPSNRPGSHTEGGRRPRAPEHEYMLSSQLVSWLSFFDDVFSFLASRYEGAT